MTELLTALALALAIEGALYALFPDGMRRVLEQVMAQPPQTLRTAGLVAAIVGVAIIWLLRGG